MATHTVNGSCHHDCPDTCGWTVTVETGPAPVAVKLRGNPDHPYSAGELCPKVNRFLDRVYAPDRILHPMIRDNIDEPWREVSWDEALDLVARKLKDLRDTHGGDSIGVFTSARVTNEEN